MKTVFIAILLLLSACGKDPLPNLLVIGDSISIGYTPYLGAQMQDFNVNHPTENCQNTTKTLAHLDAYLTESAGSRVIVWNNGNWNARDMSTFDPSSPNPEWAGTALIQYEQELIEIAQKLVATSAKIFFVTTTSTIPGNPLYIAGRAEAQNAVAKSVLPQMGITVIDLYEFQLPHTDWFLAPNDVHFKDYGYANLATFIAAEIRRNL